MCNLVMQPKAETYFRGITLQKAIEYNMELLKHAKKPLFAIADNCIETKCNGLVIHQDVILKSSAFLEEVKEYKERVFGHVNIFNPKNNESLPHIAMGYCEDCLQEKAREEERMIRTEHILMKQQE